VCTCAQRRTRWRSRNVAKRRRAEENEGQESAGRCAQRRKRTRTTEQRRNTDVVATSTVRRTGGPGLRHTTLCLFRRRRPLALRPPSAALSLPSSGITAWYAQSLIHSLRSANSHNSLAPWSVDSRRRPRRPRLLVPRLCPFVRLCPCSMRSRSNASYLSDSSLAAEASLICSPRPPALRSCSRRVTRLRVEDHSRTPPPSRPRILLPSALSAFTGHAPARTRTPLHEDARARGRRASVRPANVGS
jgi:hypothetical protein